jgi:hypothetical protein
MTNLNYSVVYENRNRMALTLDRAVSYLIREFIRTSEAGVSGKRGSMSRSKKPCTRCSTVVSSTWRPGPCGSSTLCNACGVLYMNGDQRTRMIDLILQEDTPIWVTRNSTNYQWSTYGTADLCDERIQKWKRHELERHAIHEHQSKRRKITTC